MRLVRRPALEDRVWTAVCDLIADPDRLRAMTAEYLAIQTGKVASQADKLDELRELIATREAQQTKGLAAAIRAGADDKTIAALTADFGNELAVLRRQRDDIEAIRSSTKAQAQALDRVAVVAQRAAGHLATMDGEQRAVVIGLLDIKVKPLDATRTPRLEISGTLERRALELSPSRYRNDGPSSIEA